MVVSSLIGAILGVIVVEPVHAYTGGPVRAYIAGLETARQRVFYYFIFHDESASTPQVWYFDLDGKEPARPVRVLSLEGEDDGIRSEKTGISDRWRAFSPGLVQLPALADFDFDLHLAADSSGKDPNWLSQRYDVDLGLAVQGALRTLDLVTFCDNVVRVRGVYEVPRRSEVVVVLSYKGRAYGCEEVDLPILLNPGEDAKGGLPSGVGAARAESPAGKLVAGGRIRETQDQYAPVTWFTTTRNTRKQYSDDVAFNVEFYFGKGGDGTEFIRLRTAYREEKTGQGTSRPLRYTRVHLTDDAGHYYEVPMWYPDRQVFTSPESIEVWSDDFLVGPWDWKEPPWRAFEQSRSIHVRFDGEPEYEFDLTDDQVAGIREIIGYYGEAAGPGEAR